MRMTLQEMVSSAIEEATEREKLAAEDPKPQGEMCPECENAKADCKCPPKGAVETKEKDSAGCSSKTASISTSLVEKVAQAVHFIGENLDAIDWQKVAAEGEGPGTGAGSLLETTLKNPTTGEQSYQTGQASNNQPPMNPGTDKTTKADGNVNPATSLETDMNAVPGGTGMQPTLDEPGNLSVDKKASIRMVRRLYKQAEEGGTSISAGSEPIDPPSASGSEDSVPKQPGAFEKQRGMINSNDSAINYDKGQAKAEPKARMGEVLSEPAQKKSTDPVLQNNLAAASSAGVKISSVQAAAARSYLRKIAQAEEDPNASPEDKEKAKKLKEALAKQNGEGDKEKASQGMGSPSAPMGTTQTGGML
jgi:hypothetical protein